MKRVRTASVADFRRRNFLQQALLLGGGAAAVLIAPPALAADRVRVEGMRIGQWHGHTRIVFDLSGPPTQVPQVESGDAGLDIFFPRATAVRDLTSGTTPLGLFTSISRRPSAEGLQLAIGLKGPAHWRSFTMRPSGGRGYRLVVDLSPDDGGASATSAAPGPQEGGRDIVVCLDPGHGGTDPGAIGLYGTREKDMVLDVGLELAGLLRRTPGIKLVMTREKDHYVPLVERMEFGLAHKADIFVSIHADAFPIRTVRGSTVWALSQHGASNEAARWLAKTQNAADPIIGDAQFGRHNPMLNQVLLNLSQNAAMNAAAKAADVMIRALANVEHIHNANVQHANFVVLRAPNIPSMLVETAFISNPEEELQLRRPQFRDMLAHTMRDAIVAYFVQSPPTGSRWATTRHVVRHNESLAEVAKRYRVNAEILRLANNLPGNEARAGQSLRVPVVMGA